MNQLKQYQTIVVTVGDLPEWYNEGEHDPIFESHVTAWYGKVSDEVIIEYVYNGDHSVQFFDNDGDLVAERAADLGFAFEKALAEEW